MVINGYDYKFAYTVGAYLDIAELKIGVPKTKADDDRLYVYSALAMNKGYEDRLKLDNPDYKPQYLTLNMIRSLDYSRMPEIRKEVDEAYAKGGLITVKTQPKKTAKKGQGAEVE